MCTFVWSKFVCNIGIINESATGKAVNAENHQAVLSRPESVILLTSFALKKKKLHNQLIIKVAVQFPDFPVVSALQQTAETLLQ